MKQRKLTSRTADRHLLYQESVQDPEGDARFLSRYFSKVTGSDLRLLREDFCGTAILSAEFVRLNEENRAIGVDLHAPTLAWARRNNLSTLSPDQRRRITLLRRNVLAVHRPRAQVIAALNFSYCVFKTRPALLAYFRSTKHSLRRGGLFIIDLYGGPEAEGEQQERTRLRGFTYVWDQARFDPISFHTLCRIHFEFRDGTRMRNAFVYDWRLWTIPELRELFGEAGFGDVHVLWESTNRRNGRGNGVFRRISRGHADSAYIAYIVGRA